MEEIVLGFLNFPFVFMKYVMTIELLVSITILIGLIFLVRFILLGRIHTGVLNSLWWLVILRVLMCLIWAYSKTGPVFVLEALTLPAWVKWVWGIGAVLTLILLLLMREKVSRKIYRSRIDISNAEIKQEISVVRLFAVSFFWFHPLVWLATIYASKDGKRYREEKMRCDRKCSRRTFIYSLLTAVLAAALLVSVTFTSYYDMRSLTAEQTIQQFYNFLNNEYSVGLRKLFPAGEGDFKMEAGEDKIDKIMTICDVTEDSDYDRYLGHTRDFCERRVLVADVLICRDETSRSAKRTEVFELVKREKRSGWEIVYWSEGNWGFYL